MKLYNYDSVIEKSRKGLHVLHFTYEKGKCAVEEFKEYIFDGTRFNFEPHFEFLRDFDNEDEKSNWLKILQDNQFKLDII